MEETENRRGQRGQASRAAHEKARKKGNRAPWLARPGCLDRMLRCHCSRGSLKSGRCANEALLKQSRATDQWAYYQAKGNKAATKTAELEILRSFTRPRNGSNAIRLEIQRYGREQEEIRAEAEHLQAESHEDLTKPRMVRVDSHLVAGSIGLSAIGALLESRKIWLASLATARCGNHHFICALDSETDCGEHTMDKTRKLSQSKPVGPGFSGKSHTAHRLELDIFTTIGKAPLAAEVAQRLGTELLAPPRCCSTLWWRWAPSPSAMPSRCTWSLRRWGQRGRACCTWSSLGHLGQPHRVREIRQGRPIARSRGFSRSTHPRFSLRPCTLARKTVPKKPCACPASAIAKAHAGRGRRLRRLFHRPLPSVSELRAEILDLGAVGHWQKTTSARRALQDRVRVRPGTCRTADFGEGFDLVLLSAVCHMFGEEKTGP